jgi:hypothetical protein
LSQTSTPGLQNKNALARRLWLPIGRSIMQVVLDVV